MMKTFFVVSSTKRGAEGRGHVFAGGGGGPLIRGGALIRGFTVSCP